MPEGINIVNLKDGELYHSVEVTKNTKGYNWSVKVAGGDMEEILNRVTSIEVKLKERFGEKKSS